MDWFFILSVKILDNVPLKLLHFSIKQILWDAQYQNKCCRGTVSLIHGFLSYEVVGWNTYIKYKKPVVRNIII